MERYKRHTQIDYEKYKDGKGPFEVKYGLPHEVRFCRRCVVSNQRPNSAVEHEHVIETKKETIRFDDDGICDACRYAERKAGRINWDDRAKELGELCDKFRKNDGSYDCLVPGSGGKDSTLAAHIMKYEYGMHPLTMTFSPYIYTSWGWNNLQSWIHGGFDHIMYTPNGRMYRLLTRLAVENLFHPTQPFIFGLKNMAPKAAITYNLPLVIYGENEAEYGNAIAENDSSLRLSKYFASEDPSKLFIAGTSIADMKKYFGVEDVDLKIFLPPSPEELKKHKIQVHQLGYYTKWHPQRSYFFATEKTGFKPSPERSAGTHTKYSCIDDKLDDFHYYTYYIKFGIGRSTHDCSQEIRSGDITREEGVSLVRKYDGEFPERWSEELFKSMSINPKEFPVASRMFEQPEMDRDYFMHIADKFRSPHIWKHVNGKWELRHKVWDKEWSSGVSHEKGAQAWRGNVFKPFK